MIFGSADSSPLTRPLAAQAVGLSDITLRAAFRNPVVVHHYNALLDVLRTSERPRSVQRIAVLRDEAESERVQLEAAKYLDGGDARTGSHVVVNVGVNVQPGYLTDVSEHMTTAPLILHQAGSKANVLTQHANVDDD